jgi:penicillin amidase
MAGLAADRALRIVLAVFLRRTLIVLFAAILAGGVAATLLLRGSLPRYDGVIGSPGIAAATVVERDRLGTATIRGHDRGDVTWALGYVHAQERYFEMDLMRRRAAGELSELFGPAALAMDRAARRHRMRARAAAALEALAPAQSALLARYRDGVNAGLDALQARPFPYWLTGTRPAPWRDEDSLLIVAAMAFTLNDAENRRELGLSMLHAALPEAAYRFLAAGGGAWDAPLEGDAQAWPEPPDAATFDVRPFPVPAAGHAVTEDDDSPAAWTAAVGSNAFAVAGRLADGRALVANDMHLGLSVPDIWFRARLVYPDPDDPATTIDVGGASLPGTPVIVVGSNRHVAWGFTNSYVDTVDWVRVERDPADPRRYRTPAGWATLERHDETIRVRGGPDETLHVDETIWGPLLADDVDGTPLALAWIAQEPGAFDLGLGGLDRARDVAAALDVAERAGIPPQNFVVGDHNGHIAWTIAGRVPKRGGADPSLPSDWSGGGGWQGWLAPAELPRIVDPPSGRIWSANQRHVGGEALARIGDGGYDLGARAGQIRDDLARRDRFTAADLLAIQLDDRARFLEHWRALLATTLTHLPPSTANARMRAAVEAESARHASIDSVGYRLVREWRDEVIAQALRGFEDAVRAKFTDFRMPRLAQREHAVWKLLERRPRHLLTSRYRDWDELLADCAVRVGERLDAGSDHFGTHAWGERNTASIRHPLSRALPGFIGRRFLDMPAEPLPGDVDMPRVQAPSFGASERFGVAPGDEEHGYFELPGGQSGHPLSPYYGAGHADWVAGRSTPFLPGATEHVLRFEPATASQP